MYYVKDMAVIEKNTEQVIQQYDREDKANEVCRNLNLGAGFQGWTPTFFCNVAHKKRGAKIKS